LHSWVKEVNAPVPDVLNDQKTLEQHRGYLKKHAEETNDVVALGMLNEI
jgi:hypothetical protein